MNPNYEEAYYSRGIVFYGKRQFDKAIKDYSMSIDLNHNADIFDKIYKTNAYFNRGNAYFMKGQYDNAIADYSRAIAINPSLISQSSGCLPVPLISALSMKYML